MELGLIGKCSGKTRRREGEDSKLRLFYFNFTITQWGNEVVAGDDHGVKKYC